MKYNLIIFDLDGTLLNTLEDLTDSVNYAGFSGTQHIRGQFIYRKWKPKTDGKKRSHGYIRPCHAGIDREIS